VSRVRRTKAPRTRRPTVEGRSPAKASRARRPTVEGRSPAKAPRARRPTVERRSPAKAPRARRPTVERRSPAKALRRRIGIDVGGTNTDAVLLDGPRVVHAVKTPTTADVTAGITTALRELLAQPAATPPGHPGLTPAAIMIGTTHFTNAVVQRRDLTRVAAIRIGLPASASLPPFVDWPDDLAALVRGEVVMVEGGHEYDGRPIVPLDERAIRDAGRRLREAGITSAAVTSVFSPLNAECEQRAAAILREECPGLAVTQSHELGRIGLLERENAALLNAALVDLARRTTRAFTEALRASGLTAPLYLTQNDGTVMLAATAEAFPVYSFASGPTNSMRGAAFLSGLADAIVIDVGGTTTDIGSLRHGFPREANNVVEVGGVRTLFRMPDLLSLGLGGGSHVQGEPPAVGPRSVGYRLVEQSRVFGGATLTATDIAVAAGLVDLGDRRRVADLPAGQVTAAVARMHAMIEEGVDRMKTDARDEPLIAVGGGCFLVPERLPGVSEVVHVPHQAVANAVGAAIAQVSGEVDQIFQNLSREAALAQARRIAEQRAVSAGAAAGSLAVVESEDLPLAYLPGNSLRVRVRVVGELAGA
jgi:N-methylhydantoinase A/oxoprolinase/acetone carboxylase beta subunit